LLLFLLLLCTTIGVGGLLFFVPLFTAFLLLLLATLLRLLLQVLFARHSQRVILLLLLCFAFCLHRRWSQVGETIHGAKRKLEGLVAIRGLASSLDQIRHALVDHVSSALVVLVKRSPFEVVLHLVTKVARRVAREIHRRNVPLVFVTPLLAAQLHATALSFQFPDTLVDSLDRIFRSLKILEAMPLNHRILVAVEDRNKEAGLQLIHDFGPVVFVEDRLYPAKVQLASAHCVERVENLVEDTTIEHLDILDVHFFGRRGDDDFIVTLHRAAGIPPNVLDIVAGQLFGMLVLRAQPLEKLLSEDPDREVVSVHELVPLRDNLYLFIPEDTPCKGGMPFHDCCARYLSSHRNHPFVRVVVSVAPLYHRAPGPSKES